MTIYDHSSEPNLGPISPVPGPVEPNEPENVLHAVLNETLHVTTPMPLRESTNTPPSVPSSSSPPPSSSTTLERQTRSELVSQNTVDKSNTNLHENFEWHKESSLNQKHLFGSHNFSEL